MAIIKNFVTDTCNAPGTSATINLAGAVAGRLSFAAFTTGASVYYFMDDGTQAEWGIGTFTAGAPNTLTRTVISTTAGTTSRLNFTGLTYVYSEIPAEAALYLDAVGGNLALPGNLSVAGTMAAVGSFAVSTGLLGYQRHPGGITEQWGNDSIATGNQTVTFPVAFSGTPWDIQLTVKDGPLTGGGNVIIEVGTTYTSAHFIAVAVNGSTGALAATNFFWRAKGPT